MMRRAAALLAGLAFCGAGQAVAGESVEIQYRLHCSGCHGMDGTGSKVGRIPPFAGLVGRFVDSADGRLYLVHVPGVANAGLPDADTARLLNYVMHTWGAADLPPNASDFTAEEVHSLRNVHVDDIARLRNGLGVTLAKQGHSIAY